MAEKLLKKKAHKVSPQKKLEEREKKTVLVGTYKGDQLTKWPGYYNYPISSRDKIDVESAKKVNELAKEIKAGLEIRPSKNVQQGFRLASKDGSGYFDCTDEGIMEMLMPYFRDLDFQ